MSALPRVARPADCWDWITPEQVTAHAMMAFDLARRSSRPPVGQRFIDAEGYPWSARDAFAEDLAETIGLLIKLHAHDLGIADYSAQTVCLRRRLHGHVPQNQQGAQGVPS